MRSSSSGFPTRRLLQSFNVVDLRGSGSPHAVKVTVSTTVVLNILINYSRLVYFHRRLSDGTDSGQQGRVAKELLHSSERDLTRSDAENKTLCMTFSDFFITKIRTIKDTINSKVSSFLRLKNIPKHPFTGTPLDTFPSVTPAEVLKIIKRSSTKSSSMDFIPTSLIKSCFTVFS